MIGYLKGTVLEKDSSTVVLDVQGVGYQVEVPLSTYYQVSGEGEEAELHIYTHVREDAIILFGFVSKGERALFRKLISLTGIGPKLALAIIGGIGPSELLRAVEIGDLVSITSIPGVGKKTAERLILELKSSLEQLRNDLGAAATGSSSEPRTSVHEDVISALENLGFKRAMADKALSQAQAESDGSFEELLRLSLKRLTR